MEASPSRLEAELTDDLLRLGDRFADEEFCTELYRGLSSMKWRRPDGPGGHVTLSWRRAEELVNGLRHEAGRPSLELAQTGGEGELSDLVRDELGGLGWIAQPLDTGRHDDAHVAQPESPPPADDGARHSPADDPGGWERRAQADADESRRRHS